MQNISSIETDNTSTEIVDNMCAPAKALKRICDFIGAALAMIFSSPLYLYIALRLKLTEKGRVIFKQERIGLGGKPFMIYKFRTLSEGFEDNGPRLTPCEDKAHVTGFGKFLRIHHLDELPQLFNVLKGDMSIVGPRPERKIFIDKIMERDQRYRFIYLMRPGLTSKATLFNGYTDTMEKMLQRLNMDLDYLRTRTLVGDLKIILLTVKMIFGGKKF